MTDTISVTQVMQWFATPGLALALIVFIWNFSSRVTCIERDHAALEKGMNEKHAAMDRKVDKIGDDVTWFIRSLAKDQASILHKPHPEAWRIDGLLEKLHASVLGGPRMKPDEVDLLRALLWFKQEDPETDQAEKNGASLARLAVEFLHPDHRGDNPIDLATWKDGSH